MTEQPVETEQQFLGNASSIRPRIVQQAGTESVPAVKRQAYLPNGHRLPLQSVILSDIEAARHEQILAEFDAAAVGARSLLEGAGAALRTVPQAVADPETTEPDLWLDAEKQADRALIEIQAGNINAGIACLQAALAFAQNYRHSLTEETNR